jgi:endo-1,4-beta-xylanase
MREHKRATMFTALVCAILLFGYLPAVLAAVPLLEGTFTPNSIVYLPSVFNQYTLPLRDIPIYRNSFEEITDLAASGITSSNANIRIATENVDFASGNKALKVYGTLPGPQWSNISADFSMKKFIGEDILDLSDKTIGYSDFIPNDSPIEGGICIWAMKGDKVVQLGCGLPVPGDISRHGVWQNYELDVAEVYKNGSWAYTDLSDEEARDVIKHCETISIVGGRSTAGTSAEANFYVDNLNWIRSDRFNLPINNSIDSLRKYAANQHFEFGLFSADSLIFGPENDPWNWKGDPWYAYIVAQEGDVNTIEEIRPRPNEDYSNFNYDPVQDARLLLEYQFGQAYHMPTYGYGMGWLDFEAPQWLRDLSFPDASAFLLYHTEKSLRYTQGKQPVWNLFNEFIGGEGSGSYYLNNRVGYLYDYSPWAENQNDSSLIKAAFIKARQMDPGATLIFNDYYGEQIGLGKSEFLFNFASGLKNDGIPIDGVGWELHNSIDPDGKILRCQYPIGSPTCFNVTIDMDTYLNSVDLNVKRYASVGLKVAFTEVEGQIKYDDIDFTTPVGRVEYDSRLQWQAKYFAGLLKIALENDNVIMFHMFGGTDRYQNVQDFSGYGNGFIFDKNFNPKPAYYAILELLKAP